MTEQALDDNAPMSARYAAMASKSAAKAEAAARRVQVEANSEETRSAKRARREAEEWAQTTLLDAMRAHGALSAESGQFEAVHGAADEAVKRAEAASVDAARIYREYKAGEAP